MTESEQLIQTFENRAKRREERREFFTNAAGAMAFAAVGATALSFASGAAAQSTTNMDSDILNFALNLEYLEAQFYSYAATGVGLPASLTGSGNGSTGAGTVTGGSAVDFSGDAIVGAYAREIAADEINHVTFLRTALGTTAVAQPNLDISAAGAFTTAAKAAGIDLTASGGMFDPYASPNNFLIGAFIFEDVGVTAYKGAAPLVTNKTYLEAAAGILAVEAYHASIIRTVLYGRGVATPALVTNVGKISDLRDNLDGTTTAQVAENATIGTSPDDDQGIAATTQTGPDGVSAMQSNIVPLNANGLAYSRSVGHVLNIVYGTPNTATGGLFFPQGMNANNAAFRTSTQN